MVDGACKISSINQSINQSESWSMNPEHSEPPSAGSSSHRALSLRRYRPHSRSLSRDGCRPAHHLPYWTTLNIICTSETMLATLATAQKCRGTAVVKSDWYGGDHCRRGKLLSSSGVILRNSTWNVGTKGFTLILRKVFPLPHHVIFGHEINQSKRV